MATPQSTATTQQRQDIINRYKLMPDERDKKYKHLQHLLEKARRDELRKLVGDKELDVTRIMNEWREADDAAEDEWNSKAESDEDPKVIALWLKQMKTNALKAKDDRIKFITQDKANRVLALESKHKADTRALGEQQRQEAVKWAADRDAELKAAGLQPIYGK